MRELIRDWFAPAPDSLVARDKRRGRSPWVNAVHLLWSVWVFIIPMFDGFTWRWALCTLLSYPIFLFLYGKCCTVSQRTAYRYALGLVAMSFVLLPWYPSALSYFVYGCVMLCTCRLGLRGYLLVLAGLNVVCLVEVWLLHYPWQAVAWIPVTTIIVGMVVNAERQADQKELELSLSHEEVRRLAALAERERIGRDLHDLLGHTLSLITLKLELSRKLFDRDSEAARREMEEAEKVARHALSEVRSAVTGIRATDLAAELAAARLMLGASAVQLESTELPPSLPADVERALALVLREAITNIARHAGARKARVAVVASGAQVQMSVEDDGRGGIDSQGNGLSGMHERVRGLGGTLTVDSPRGQGTRLHIKVPLRARLSLVGDAASAPEWTDSERQAS